MLISVTSAVPHSVEFSAQTPSSLRIPDLIKQSVDDTPAGQSFVMALLSVETDSGKMISACGEVPGVPASDSKNAASCRGMTQLLPS